MSLAQPFADRRGIDRRGHNRPPSTMAMVPVSGPRAGAMLSLAADPGLSPVINSVLHELVRGIHGHVTVRARHACVYLSLIARDVLIARGFDAHVEACIVSARSSRIAVGTRVGRCEKPGSRVVATADRASWQGHLVCVAGDALIDLTVGQIVRRDLWPVFPAVALAEVRSDEAAQAKRHLAHMELSDMPAGALLRRLDFMTDRIVLDWHACDDDQSWMGLTDADPRHRQDMVARLAQSLPG
jgi:hypothetical protein